MKTLIIPMILAVSIISFGQGINQNVVSTAGDHYITSNASLSWTLGEVSTETYTNIDGTLNQGFHQGSLFISSIIDELNLNVVVKAYPNPVKDILIIETQDQDKKYQIIDMFGKVINSGATTREKEKIDFTNIPSGVYFITVDQHKTHKFLKQ